VKLETKIKITYLILGISLIIFPQTIKAIEKDEFHTVSIGGINAANGVNCFDYYHFGSIEINLTPKKTFYQPGEIVKVEGVIKNTNNYPIVQGSLLAQIWRENLENPGSGNYLVDEFFALKNIYLAPGGAKDVQFEWLIPAGISAGKYFLTTHFLVAEKLNLSGLSFVEGVYGGITDFTIKEGGGTSEVFFDKSKVFFNGEPYPFRSFIPQVSSEKGIKIDFVLKNLSQYSQEVEISKKLFRWDNLVAEQLQKEEKEKVKIAPKSTKSFSLFFSNLPPDVYILEATAKNAGSKSILKTRFVVQGKNPPARINFFGPGSFPLKKGEQNYIFTCFHSVLDGGIFKGKVVTTLRDETGQPITSLEYSGEITPQIMATKKDFQPEKDYYKVNAETTIFDQNGKIVDKVNLVYSLDQFTDPVDFKIDLEKGKLTVKPLNWKGDLAPAKMAIEVYDQDRNLIFFEPHFTGQEFEKPIKLEGGKNYQINVVSLTGIKKTVTISYPKITSILPILLAVFLAIAIIIGLIIIRGSRKHYVSKN